MKYTLTLAAVFFGFVSAHPSYSQIVDLSEAIGGASRATATVEWKQPKANVESETLRYYGDLKAQGTNLQVPQAYLKALDARANVERQSAATTYTNGTFLSADGILVAPTQGGNSKETRIVVKYDGKEYNAKLLLVDERCQLCLIKIDAEETDFVDAFTDDYPIGSVVANVSTALDGTAVAAAGIVAAVDRKIGAKFPPMLQTDVSVDVGSSGSPLLNSKGQLAGIIVAKEGTKSSGASFAVPSSHVSTMLQELKAKKAKDTVVLRRAFLGVQLGVNERSQGVIVEAVLPKSSAEKAGIQVGDRILAVNEQEVSSPDATVNLLSREDVGALIRIKLVRDDMEFEIPANLGERTDDAYVTSKTTADAYSYTRVYPPQPMAASEYQLAPPSSSQRPKALSYPQTAYSALQVQRAKSDVEIAKLMQSVEELSAKMKAIKALIAELQEKMDEQ